MTRYKLVIEYDGRDFVGWQRQDNGPSVQAALEEAVRGFCGEAVTAHAAGRTDAGVHALGQVAHIDVYKDTTADTLRDALNAHLKPAPVAVLSAEAVDDDFHARFSAKQRAYLYRIVNRRAPPVLDRGRVWFVPVPLDATAMHDAARVLVGHHDFTSFRSTECQSASPVKTLDRLDVTRENVRHVAFGHGIHHCLGAQLARLEAGLALEGLITRFPDLRLAAERVEWGRNTVLRGPVSLPLVL